jgi:hypothetical protein
MRDKVQTMKPIFKVAVAAIFVLIAGRALAQADTDDAPHALPASIVTLLAQPAISNAKRVQVSGYLALDFEGEALYLHKEDYQEGLTRNAIRLSLTPEQEKKYKDLAGTYVTIEASFLKRRNSEDIFTGSLFNVREIRKTLGHH